MATGGGRGTEFCSEVHLTPGTAREGLAEPHEAHVRAIPQKGMRKGETETHNGMCGECSQALVTATRVRPNRARRPPPRTSVLLERRCPTTSVSSNPGCQPPRASWHSAGHCVYRIYRGGSPQQAPTTDGQRLECRLWSPPGMNPVPPRASRVTLGSFQNHFTCKIRIITVPTSWRC